MKTVIEMANEILDRMAPDDHCRAPYWTATDEELERFAELVRADEREACAKLADSLGWVNVDHIRARGAHEKA